MPKDAKKHRSNPFLQAKSTPKSSKPTILVIGGDDWSKGVDKRALEALESCGFNATTLVDELLADSTWLNALTTSICVLSIVDGLALMPDWYDDDISQILVMVAGHEDVPVFYADEVARVNASDRACSCDGTCDHACACVSDREDVHAHDRERAS